MEFITKTKTDHRYLLFLHFWGCPACVIGDNLKNNQNIPKCYQRSQLGLFLGFSDKHSSLVANVIRLKTRYLSPQYNVVFYYLFQTVFSSGENNVYIGAICIYLWGKSSYLYAKPEYEDGQLVYKPQTLS